MLHIWFLAQDADSGFDVDLDPNPTDPTLNNRIWLWPYTNHSGSFSPNKRIVRFWIFALRLKLDSDPDVTFEQPVSNSWPVFELIKVRIRIRLKYQDPDPHPCLKRSNSSESFKPYQWATVSTIMNCIFSIDISSFLVHLGYRVA
mgnify:CR=1 FL=1